MRSPSLADAIEGLELPADRESIAEVLRLRDRLEAKLALGVAAFEKAGGHELDHATSAVAWLRTHGLSVAAAGSLLRSGRRALEVPELGEAWVDGRLGSGHVQAIVANVSERTAALFAEHAAALLPSLEDLTAREAAIAMQAWRAQADALLDVGNADGDDRPPTSTLHLSRTFGGFGELQGSFTAGDTSVVEAALRVATMVDDEATGVRLPAERRADALVDVCRWFLDHQDAADPGRRHRPHVNVVVDLVDLHGNGGGGRSVESQVPLEPHELRTLLCDANLHRVVTDGRSTILDYGRSTRTAPPPLFTALSRRDGHCRLVEGCDRGPEWCDAHHVRPWEDGGGTSLDNMVLACSRHHHLLHRQRWRQRLAGDGRLTIETPDGRTWTTHARGSLPFEPLLAAAG